MSQRVGLCWHADCIVKNTGQAISYCCQYTGHLFPRCLQRFKMEKGKLLKTGSFTALPCLQGAN